jgi:hypothetical protein
MRVRRKPSFPNRNADKRSLEPVNQQAGERQPERSTSHTPPEGPRHNVWSFLVHGTSTWSILSRVLVLLLAGVIALLFIVVIFLVSGYEVGPDGIHRAPVQDIDQRIGGITVPSTAIGAG